MMRDELLSKPMEQLKLYPSPSLGYEFISVQKITMPFISSNYHYCSYYLLNAIAIFHHHWNHYLGYHLKEAHWAVVLA